MRITTKEQLQIAWRKLKDEQTRAWESYKECVQKYGKGSVDAAQAIQYWNGITTAVMMLRGIGDFT